MKVALLNTYEDGAPLEPGEVDSRLVRLAGGLRLCLGQQHGNTNGGDAQEPKYDCLSHPGHNAPAHNRLHLGVGDLVGPAFLTCRVAERVPKLGEIRRHGSVSRATDETKS